MYFDSLENNPSLLTMGRHDMYDDGEQTGKRLHFQTRKKKYYIKAHFPHILCTQDADFPSVIFLSLSHLPWEI